VDDINIGVKASWEELLQLQENHEMESNTRTVVDGIPVVRLHLNRPGKTMRERRKKERLQGFTRIVHERY
jgi:hypothetical protein